MGAKHCTSMPLPNRPVPPVPPSGWSLVPCLGPSHQDWDPQDSVREPLLANTPDRQWPPPYSPPSLPRPRSHSLGLTYCLKLKRGVVTQPRASGTRRCFTASEEFPGGGVGRA